MDEARIRQLTEEVLGALRAPAGAAPGDLQARVAALERAVRELSQPRPTVAAVLVAAAPAPSHPSFRLLDVGAGGGHCVLEPDKPCVQSGQCRQLGH